MNDQQRAENHEEMLMSLHMASQVLLKLRKKELVSFGITPEGNIIMTSIKTLGEKATSAEIARHIFREPNSVSAMLKRMEDKGLVTKVKPEHNSNKRIIILTSEGEKVFQEINNIRNHTLDDITSFMSEEEEKKFTDQLKQLIKQSFKVLGMTQLPSAIRIELD